MKVGVISDVHANLPALEAVLADMPRVDDVVCAGDVIGYNPWPAACLARVREVASITVRGNHDATVETPERYRANRMAQAGLEHAKAELTETEVGWLRDRPRTATIGESSDPFLLVHSHPSSDREGAYVYPEEFQTLARFVDADDYAGIVLGHTHVQAAERVGDGLLVVNPGSVGQPRDADPDAAYAVLDTARREVDLRRVDYDRERVRSAVESAGLPSRTAERLFDGR